MVKDKHGCSYESVQKGKTRLFCKSISQESNYLCRFFSEGCLQLEVKVKLSVPISK